MKPTKNIFSLLILLLTFGCQNQSNSPSARYGAKMIYDPIEGRAILFGGRTDRLVGLKYFDDLWAFDFQSQSWERIETDTQPAGRLSPGMVYDPDSRQIILFGGHTKEDRVNDTWVYDITANLWEEVTSENSPPPRSDMGMVYDEANEVVILFGGYCRDDVRELCDDTWVFDPQTNTWTEMNPVNHPPVMYGHSLTYDPVNQQSLLWGGHMAAVKNGVFSSMGYSNTLWGYSYPENDWEEIPSPRTQPTPRYWQMADFEPSSGHLFLFGGNGGNGFLADTWLFDTATKTWEKTSVKDAPAPRINAAIIYDPARDVILLFGGFAEDRSSFQDTWVFTQAEAEQEWRKIQ